MLIAHKTTRPVATARGSVTWSRKPEAILNALKANATRSMRDAGCWRSDQSPWTYRGSKKYLWTEKELADAIAYVEYDQGGPLP